MAKKSKNFIQNMNMKKGALHRELHVKEGEKIPEKKMQKALHSDNPRMRKQTNLARTLSGLRKTGHKGK